MLKLWQVAALTGLGIVLWGFVTFGIHANPAAVIAPDKGVRGLIMGPVGGVVSVLLCKLAGRLGDDEIVLGVCVVGAVAMVLDGIALRWLPALYTGDERVLHLAGADLLWGYGVGLLAALAWQGVALARRRPA
jgi:hypothetical protein